MRTIVVYLHRNNINNEVFYIGKGIVTDKHNRPIEKILSRRNLKWIEYVKNINNDYSVEIVKKFDNEKDALKFELNLHREYWSIGQAKCCMLYSEDWRKSMEEVWLDKERNRKISIKQTGRTVSEEQRNKISNTLKGRYCREFNSNKRQVVKMDLDGNELKVYDTITEASKDVNGSTSHISKCCKGRMNTHKGFRWRYYEYEGGIK